MQLDVIFADAAEKSGAKSLTDLLADLPGVDVKTQGGPGLGAISVRGISTGDQTVSTVGTYIDDVAFGSYSAFVNGPFNALQMSLLDLNHVELLRGPQGTLYGAGAMGGLLKYVTTEPDSYDLYGKVGLTLSNTKGGGISNTENGVINLPLKQGVAGLRVAAFDQRDSGYVKAVGPAAGNRINGGDTKGVRAALELTPTRDLVVRLSVLDQDLKRDGIDFVDYDSTTGRPVTEPATRYLAQREPYQSKINLGSADVEYNMPSIRFNSITSLQRVQLHSLQDNTPVYAPDGLVATTAVQSVGTYIASNLKKFTQEFRLTSKDKGTFEWLAGLFLDHETGANNQGIGSILPDGSTGPALLNAQLPTKYDEAALYGNATWNVSDSFSLTGGLRVAHNRQTYQQIEDGLFVGDSTNLSSKSSETSKTYLLTAKYALTPKSNVYARAASGYRPGGPNAAVDDPTTGKPVGPPTFQHDSLWSYEAGYKADLFDNALSIESAVYDIRWHNIQQIYSVNGNGVVVNAGKAEVQGFELGVAWRPTSRWTVTGNLATIDGRLKQDAPGLGMSGQRLPNSPALAASLGTRATFDLGGHAAYAGFSERHAGERNAGFEGSGTAPNYRMPAYWLTDLQGGVDFGKLSLALYARNIFDRHAQLGASTSEMALGGPAQVVPARPRTLGMTLTASF